MNAAKFGMNEFAKTARKTHNAVRDFIDENYPMTKDFAYQMNTKNWTIIILDGN